MANSIISQTFAFLKENFPIFKNKYFIVITSFLAWVVFLDDNSIANDIKYKQEKRELQKKIEAYKADINESIKKNEELKSNNENLEKFAREQYKMKREKEDIYIIQ